MQLNRLGGAAALWCAALLSMALWACTPTVSRGDDLSRALARGVSLLEAKDDRRFLEEFMIPYQRQRSMPGLPDDKVAHFRSVAAERLLLRLREAMKVTPKVNESRTEATYAIEPELRMVRVDGIWRIAD